MSPTITAKSPLAKIKDILAEEFEIDPDKVTTTARLNADLGFDSLDQVELALAVEHALRIEINDVDLEAMTTVGDLVAIIERALT